MLFIFIMMSVRYICVLSVFLLSTIFLVSLTEGGRHDAKYGRRNIIQGERKYGDRLLFYDHAVQPASYWRVVSTDVEYPGRGQRKNTTTITCFRIMDNMKNGKSGYAFVDNGGVGRTYLSIHLKSQRGEGFDFITEIYGFPRYGYV